MKPAATLSTRKQQTGAGMMETMIGILIGLLVVLVVYNMLAVAEGYKRTTTGAADAQITGLIGQFVSGQDAANGGNGLTSAFADLMNCHRTEGDVDFTAENTLKPISVIVTTGALPTDSDTFVSRQSASPHVVWPVSVRLPSPNAGDDIVVQSPNGFSTPAKVSMPTVAQPFWAVALANDGTGRCGLIQITNSTASDDVTGEVTLTQGTIKTTIPYLGIPINDSGTGAFLLNLGRVNGGAARVRYDVANGQLRTTNCMFPTGCTGVAAVPIAQNVVWMKVQYGIDTSAILPNGSLDGTVECWTPADDSTCALGDVNWLPATLAKAGDPAFPTIPAIAINRIVAVRIGLVIRSDEPDLRNPSLYVPASFTPDGTAGTRPDTYLFNCAADTDAGCQNRLLIPAGAAAPNVLLDGWRYRTYEAVIPLRNSIYNATMPP